LEIRDALSSVRIIFRQKIRQGMNRSTAGRHDARSSAASPEVGELPIQEACVAALIEE